MSKHKIKRIERIFGWTKASHKGAIKYFSKEKEDKPVRSLKKKKGCKFNKKGHIFEITKVYLAMYVDSRIFNVLSCKLCGKKDYKYGDIGVVGSTVPCEGISKSSSLL